MLFKGMSTGPDREYYLSDGGKLWMPAARGSACSAHLGVISSNWAV